MANFVVVRPDSPANKRIYKDLGVRWWNWVYGVNCDNASFPDLTFLRGDIIGSERDVGPQILSTPVTQMDRHTGDINIKSDNRVFFTVYGSHFAVGDPSNGGKCENTNQCLEAARKDFKELTEKWAKIQASDGHEDDIVPEPRNALY